VGVAFVYNRNYSKFDYGPSHPLRINRLSLTVALMGAYGLLDHPDLKMIEAEPASQEALLTFHAPEYLTVLRQANEGRFRPGLAIFGLGPGDNPVFPGVYDWAALLTGASLQASRAVTQGQASIGFNIAGGMHHAQAGNASGFCYINDAVITILDLVKQGLKVAYVDIDAHHGDGRHRPGPDHLLSSERPEPLSRNRLRQGARPGPGPRLCRQPASAAQH